MITSKVAMESSRAAAAVLSCIALGGGALGCGGDGGETAPPHGGQPGCEAPEVALPDGSCIRPGVAPDGCAEGFVHDGGHGCEPILPAEPCPYGLMAVPGETACRPVMDCGEDRWGNIAVDAATVYVDASYAGGGSDGTDARPLSSIGAAVRAAAPGALIAVAEGRYHEDLVIEGKPVRLWGRCPDMVEIAGVGVDGAAVIIMTQASGTEMGGFAISGPAMGVVTSGSEDVSLERLWVRDCGGVGIGVADALGATSARIAGSLVEHNRESGVFLEAAEATIDSTVVRATLPRASDQRGGRGISIELACNNGVCEPARRSVATVRGSLVEHNHGVGVIVVGSDATIDSTVVRATEPQVADQRGGRGINVQPACSPATCDPRTRSVATVRGSLVEQNHELGLFIKASEATIDSTVVRATLPQVADQAFGRGISIESWCQSDSVCAPDMRSVATIRNTLVEQHHDVGLFVAGSDATVESTVVRATLPQISDQAHGRGVCVQLPCNTGGCDPAAGSTATVRGSLVEHNHDLGLCVIGSDATIDNTVVRATLPRALDGLFGDGVAVVSENAAASAALSTLLVDDSARAAVASFGAAVSLSSSQLRCAAFALNGDRYDDRDFTFEDGGGNLCGCPAVQDGCKVISAGLEPPEALGSE